MGLLEWRPSGGPSEEHVLALEALHAAGQPSPESAIRLVELARGHERTDVEGAAVTIKSVRALGKLARPLIERDANGSREK